MNYIQKFLFFSRPYALSRDLNRRIRFLRAREFVLVRGNGVSALLGAFMLSLILYASHVPLMTIAVWFAVIFVIALLIFAFERRVLRVQMNESNLYNLVYYRLALGIALSTAWGSSVFFVPAQESLYLVFLFLTLSTMVTLGVLGFGTMPAYFFILDFFGLAPITAFFGFYAFVYQELFFFLLLVFALVWQTVVLKRAYGISEKVIGQLIYKEQLKEEIEEHKRSKAIIEHLAHHDHLTHIANRRYFESHARKAIEESKASGKSIVLMLIDLDNFKPINDTYGHHVGDKLLQRIASAIEASLAPHGFAARIGGDEFAVLFENIEEVSSVVEYEKLLKKAINTTFDIGNITIVNHVSIGCANTFKEGTTLEELYREADARMYEEKRGKK